MEGRRADEGERRKVDKRWVMGMEGGSVDGVRVGVPQRRRKTAVYRVKTEKPRLCYEVAEDRANGGQGGVDVRCGNGTDRSATWVRESEWAHRVQQQNPSTELGNWGTAAFTSGPGHAVFIAGGTGPSLTSEPEIQSCTAKDANHDGRVIGARSPAASPREERRSITEASESTESKSNQFGNSN